MHRSLALIALLLPLLTPGRAQSGGASSSSSLSISGSSAGSSGSSASGFAVAGAADAEQLLEEVHRSAMAMMEQSRAQAGFGAPPAPPAPVLVATRPLDAAGRAEWTEDLAVLDKLLQDALARASGRTGGQALGVRLTLTGRPAAAPMYIEDLGVLLQGEVRFPLAPSPAGNAAPPAGSAWDRARHEVRGSTTRSAAGGSVTESFSFSSGGPREAFDAARVKQLGTAIEDVLAEARHLRRLAPGQSVTVTLAGRDAAGEPARATFRATQADLAALAAGKLAPAEFKARVARSVPVSP